MTPLITRRELVEFLNDYLSNAPPPERQVEFERHLAACPACVAYMNTDREAVALGKRVACGLPEAPVEDVPQDLLQAILAARANKR